MTEPVAYLRDAHEGKGIECLVPAAKGDPGAFPVYKESQRMALTATMLADALDHFWNAALGAARGRQTEAAAALADVMVQGVSAVAQGLREIALATREEAPAEAGEEINWKAEYETLCGQTIQDREAIAKIIDPEAFVPMEDVIGMRKAFAKADAVLALRAQPPAREDEGGTLDPAFVAWLKERDCLPNDDDGTIEWADIICALNDWEADLTQAREDAQPFMFAYEDVDKPGDWRAFRHQIRRTDGSICPGRALYTHPAPDTLRVAVEALEKIADARVFDERGEDYRGIAHPYRACRADETEQVAIKALAALQAEQKGGAA